MDIIELESLYSLKIYLIKYLATEIALIKFIGIICCIFIRQLTTTIIFIKVEFGAATAAEHAHHLYNKEITISNQIYGIICPKTNICSTARKHAQP